MRYLYFKDHVFKSFNRAYRDFKEIEVLFAKNENESREKKIYVQTNRKCVFYM